MSTKGFEPPDLHELLAQLYPDASPAQAANLLGASFLGDPWRRPEPQLGPVPETTRGFRLRVDLLGTKPPVWRRVEVPGDITLPRLHEVLQATMGWSDSHLHRFRTGGHHSAPAFVTQFDLDEGDEGMLEDDVRLDQLVSVKGDRLWYDYDFGDDWGHVLRVEKVLDTPPEQAACLTGKLACPPEDCGGIGGYRELADWVRSDYDADLRPEVFSSCEEGREWLPDGWHPDVFDLSETNELLAAVTSDPIPVTEELASLLELSLNRGSRSLRDILAHPATHGPVEVDEDETARLTEPLRGLLEVIGDGVSLTGAGYLKPADVEQIAERTGITGWWIGKANREDLTPPVVQLRAAARSLGLVSVRKGRVLPTEVAKRCRDDPRRLLRHIVDRLPLGKTAAERHAGWATLAVVGSETPLQLWDQMTSTLLFDLGWRDGRDGFALPPAQNATLDVLRLLAAAPRGRPSAPWHDPAVAAAARAAMRP